MIILAPYPLLMIVTVMLYCDDQVDRELAATINERHPTITQQPTIIQQPVKIERVICDDCGNELKLSIISNNYFEE